MAKGKMKTSTIVTIEWDRQTEKLLGPSGGHYLPCENCGKVEEVSLAVVSYVCCACESGLNVRPENACPGCGEQAIDKLAWCANGVNVRCLSCRVLYTPDATTSNDVWDVEEQPAKS